MADTTGQRINFARDVVQKSAALEDALNDVEVLLQRWYDLQLAETFVASDFTGDLVHLDATTLTNAIVTFGNLKMLMDAGNRVNLAKVRR